jgi:hypothetical protein
MEPLLTPSFNVQTTPVAQRIRCICRLNAAVVGYELCSVLPLEIRVRDAGTLM